MESQGNKRSKDHPEKENRYWCSDSRSRGNWRGWCDSWMRNDKLDSIGWAVFFIWGILVLLYASVGNSLDFSWWALLFIGGGVISLIQAAVRSVVPRFRRRLIPSLFLGFFLICIGLHIMGHSPDTAHRCFGWWGGLS